MQTLDLVGATAPTLLPPYLPTLLSLPLPLTPSFFVSPLLPAASSKLISVYSAHNNCGNLPNPNTLTLASSDPLKRPLHT